MKEEKSSIEVILNTVGQIIGAFIIWFVIGAGWNGWHDWFCKRVLKKVPSEKFGEKFGKGVFLFWIVGNILAIHIATVTQSPTLLLTCIKVNIYFAIVTIIGLLYFFKNLKK